MREREREERERKGEKWIAREGERHIERERERREREEREKRAECAKRETRSACVKAQTTEEVGTRKIKSSTHINGAEPRLNNKINIFLHCCQTPRAIEKALRNRKLQTAG